MTITIKTGVDSGEQECSYMNGTLQTVNDKLAMTIHAYLTIPTEISGQRAVAAYVRRHLTAAQTAAPGLSFEVEIGKDADNL